MCQACTLPPYVRNYRQLIHRNLTIKKVSPVQSVGLHENIVDFFFLQCYIYAWTFERDGSHTLIAWDANPQLHPPPLRRDLFSSSSGVGNGW